MLRVQKIELEWSCRCRESAGSGERCSGAVLELLPVVARMSYSVCATSLVSQGHVPELCPPVPICSIARSPQPRLCGTWEGDIATPPSALLLGLWGSSCGVVPTSCTPEKRLGSSTVTCSVFLLNVILLLGLHVFSQAGMVKSLCWVWKKGARGK